MEAYTSLERQVGADLAARVGLPHSWFEVLLRISRSEGGLASMSALADQVALTGGGATRLVDRMSRDGLVERVPCSTDRRVVYVRLTEQGRALLEKAAVVHEDNLRRLLHDFTGDEIEGLEAVCRRLRQARLAG